MNNNQAGSAEQDTFIQRAEQRSVGHYSGTVRCQRWRGPGPGQIRTRDQS